MKITHKIMASAIAFAVGLSTASAGKATNSWFAVDFTSGYTDNGAIDGVTESGEGTWSKTGADASIMVDLAGESLTTAGQASGNIGKIDAQGGALTWTPTAATGNIVLLDADVYMVGSDQAPSPSSGTVQTEVYLTNTVSSSYLCAHVGNGVGGNTWVQLAGVAVTNQTWIRLRIEIDYDQTPNKVSYQVNGILMDEAGAGTQTSFPVMTDGASQTSVSSVSFMGTGYLDNFVGRTVAITADGPTFTTGNNTNSVTGATGGSNYSVDEDSVNATFIGSIPGVGDIRYITLTDGAGYARTIRTSVGGTFSFSTADLSAGTYSIVGFYGTAPTLTAGVVPAAETVGVNKAAEVVEVGGAKKLSVTVVPKSGLYYTLFVGANPNSLTAGANSVLAGPADQDAGFMKMAMPVPAQANGVNIIKIYASDEYYTQGASAQ